MHCTNASIYDGDNFSQETCGVDKREREWYWVYTYKSMITGENLCTNCNLQLQSICNLIESELEISNHFCSIFLSIGTQCCSGIILKKKDKFDKISEWISYMLEVDTDIVCVQKKTYSEFYVSKKV